MNQPVDNRKKAPSLRNVPSAEEMDKFNREEKPALVKAIQKSWGKVMMRVKRMQEGAVYIDKRG